MTPAERYRALRAQLPARVALVAVTKGRSDADVRALFDAGARDFGENRADALAARAKAFPDARWHFIGHLQRNKVKHLAGSALVHSFDRAELALLWPAGVPVLLQVDFTGLPQRSGLAPDEARAALEASRAAGVDVKGLCTLPAPDADALAAFRALRAMRDELGLRELSMGMSADWRVAVEEGATMVRVGRALFEA